MDKIKVVQVGFADEDLINQIVDITNEFAHESHIYERLGFNKEKFYWYVKHHTKNPAFVYAAVQGGKVISYCMFEIENMYIDKWNFEIVTIYTPPTHRGSGAAQMLVEYMVMTMDHNNCAYGQVSICCAMKEDAELIDRLTANMFKKHGFYQIGIIMGRKGITWDSLDE